MPELVMLVIVLGGVAVAGTLAAIIIDHFGTSQIVNLKVDRRAELVQIGIICAIVGGFLFSLAAPLVRRIINLGTCTIGLIGAFLGVLFIILLDVKSPEGEQE